MVASGSVTGTDLEGGILPTNPKANPVFFTDQEKFRIFLMLTCLHTSKTRAFMRSVCKYKQKILVDDCETDGSLRA